MATGRAEAAARPHLDLGLDTRELVRQVPLFEPLGPADLEKICRLLRPRFAVPGERLIRRGERGNEMYFISSGALEVSVGKNRVRLGRGDFVGELALLDDQRRRADVTTLGYCHLLVLGADDFKSLLAMDPAIRDAINRVASDRLRDESRGAPGGLARRAGHQLQDDAGEAHVDELHTERVNLTAGVLTESQEREVEAGRFLQLSDDPGSRVSRLQPVPSIEGKEPTLAIVAEDVAAAELRDAGPAIDEAADHRDAFVVIVLRDRIDQAEVCPSAGRVGIVGDESGTGSVRIEAEPPLLERPTIVAAADHEVDPFLDESLSYVRGVESTRGRIERGAERIAEP